MGNATHIRQTNIQNGTVFQQPITSGIVTTPTNIVRVNQPQQTIQNQGHYVPQTVWTNNSQIQPQQQHHQQQFTLQKQPSFVLQNAPVKSGKIKYNLFLFISNQFNCFRTHATAHISRSNKSYYSTSGSSNSDIPTDFNNIFRISNKWFRIEMSNVSHNITSISWKASTRKITHGSILYSRTFGIYSFETKSMNNSLSSRTVQLIPNHSLNDCIHSINLNHIFHLFHFLK